VSLKLQLKPSGQQSAFNVKRWAEMLTDDLTEGSRLQSSLDENAVQGYWLRQVNYTSRGSADARLLVFGRRPVLRSGTLK
jgi:hypothetical protein